MKLPAWLKRPRFEQLGRRLRPHLGAGDSLLDVGAGSGRLSAWLRDRLGVRPTLCDAAGADARERSLPFLPREDPHALPAEAGAFDVVLLAFVLHHLEEWPAQERLVREAARVARRTVLIIEDTPESAWDRGANKLFDWALNAPSGIPVPFTFRSPGEWLAVIERSGLRTRHAETFRSGWPTFGLYRQSLFAAEPMRA